MVPVAGKLLTAFDLSCHKSALDLGGKCFHDRTVAIYTQKPLPEDQLYMLLFDILITFFVSNILHLDVFSHCNRRIGCPLVRAEATIP